jgi:hypothetical protein
VVAENVVAPDIVERWGFADDVARVQITRWRPYVTARRNVWGNIGRMIE